MCAIYFRTEEVLLFPNKVISLSFIALLNISHLKILHDITSSVLTKTHEKKDPISQMFFFDEKVFKGIIKKSKCHVLPQSCSSSPPAQSLCKSHLQALGIHLPFSPHWNCSDEHLSGLFLLAEINKR